MRNADNTEYGHLLDFWFNALTMQDRFAKNERLDRLIERRFVDVHCRAAHGELWPWRESALGCLAEIIVLDQFSRNMFRGQARAFAYDGMALVLAQQAVRLKRHMALAAEKRAFLLMP